MHLMNKDTLENGVLYGLKAHLDSIVVGHYHMWFILMIIGMYMCTPFLKKIVSEEKTTKYFLGLSFIFAIFITWIIQLTNDFIAYKNDFAAKVVGAVNTNLSSMCMNMVLGFSFYFVLGYYLDKRKIEKRYRCIVYIIGVIGFAFTIIVDSIIAIRTQQYCNNYYGNFNVNVVCEAVAIHTLVKYHDYRSETLNKFAITISKYGFGV
ncbi:hypothetical protein SAMN04487831_11256 [Pseudobutyrivibrio sp. UC1225]|nr:acyltransferase family protein [Pseudobutyrivibrio sp. UC1225]SFO21732.1 hypothetical protein SAMN04487831_11256 [Pseudobutyrivibrio sp. UC1225]